MPTASAIDVIALLVAAAIAFEDPPTPSALAAAGIVVLVAAIATDLMTRRTIRRLDRDPVHSARTPRHLARQLQITHCAGVLATLAAYIVIPRHVATPTWTTLLSSATLSGALTLLPLMGLLVIRTSATYSFSRALLATHHKSPARSRRAHIAVTLREHFGLVLVPLMIAWIVIDLVRLIGIDHLFAEHRLATAVAATVVFLIAFPRLVLVVWNTTPLRAGPLRTRLERLAFTNRAALPPLYVWNTRNRLSGALLVGCFWPHRSVVLTDGLIARLTDDQIEAVVAHELAHLQHRHPQLRLMALLAPLAAAVLVLTALPLDATAALSLLADSSPILFSVLLLVASFVLILAFGPWARLLETQADLTACRLLEPYRSSDDLHPTAARPHLRLGRALAALEPARRQASWQHPSLAARLAQLRRLRTDPAAAAA